MTSLTQGKRTPMSSYSCIPLAILTAPKDGTIVYLDRWWAVTADDQALFYRGASGRINSPQCNRDRRVVESLLLPEGCKVVHVPVAYLRHNCNDYV